jgi:bacillithiol biosynthesis cysteine-adding enzyme BshC
LQPGIRARIVREGERFNILGTGLSFTETEMEAELQAYPERFSPNVVLRPLYQETILPNLAYIGGGGEIAYWLERKAQFEHFNVNFPMLVRRNSVLWIDRGTSQKLERLGIAFQQLFQDTDLLVRQFIEAQSETALDLQAEIQELASLFERVREKAVPVDPTLEKAVMAESVKQIKVLEQLESRLMRAEKQKHETSVNQIRALREKLFPGNGLQERQDNFLNFYQKYGETFFHVLKNHLHPLENGFLVIEDV